MAQLRQYLDAFELFWQERIVGFGSNDQAAMLLGLQRWLASYERSGERGWFAWTDAIGRWASTIFQSGDTESGSLTSRVFGLLSSAYVFGLLLVLGVLAGGGLWWRHLRSWHRNFGKDQTGSAIAFYQEMLGRLERAGLKRDQHLTPREFAASVELPAVVELTRLYERARFSGEVLNDRDLTRIRQLLSEIKSVASNLSQKGRWRFWRPSHTSST